MFVRNLTLSVFALAMMGALVISSINAKSAFASEYYDPAGYWIVKKKDVVIHMSHCGDELCGRIYWLRADAMQTDDYNPNSKLQARPLCGVDVLWGARQSKGDHNFWKSGTIYKANDGDHYKAQITMADVDTLELRGYIGFPAIGKTSTLTRVNPADYEQCASVFDDDSLPEKTDQSQQIEKTAPLAVKHLNE